MNANAELQHLEQLSESDLRAWLRRVIWTSKSHPLVIPSTDQVIPYVAELLKRGSPELTANLRLIIPGLLQEWGSRDSAETLDSLLLLCGNLRCAEAEPTIALIATDRLKRLPKETFLRQRCLGVLSGFGCTTRTRSLFSSFIKDIDYAALCYRALYRFDLSFAASEITTIIKAHEEANRREDLEAVLDMLFLDYATEAQRTEIWLRVFRQPGLDTLASMLQSLQKVGIFVSVKSLGKVKTEEVETLEVFYQRADKQSKPDQIPSFSLDDEVVLVISHLTESFLVSGQRLGRLVASANNGSFQWT